MLPSQVSAAIYFTLFVVALTGIPARATEVDVPSEASDFIALLAFVSDAQLTDPERERVSAQTQSDLHADSAGVRRTDLKVRKLLASLPRAEAWERADQRETLRLQIEMMPASNPARKSSSDTTRLSSSIVPTSA